MGVLSLLLSLGPGLQAAGQLLGPGLGLDVGEWGCFGPSFGDSQYRKLPKVLESVVSSPAFHVKSAPFGRTGLSTLATL